MAALLNHMKQREAKYIFLVNWIKDRIGTRELRPGEKLYSENELSEMFDLSRQTVRHAIGILEAEGLVERIRGSGTYIGRQRKYAKEDHEHCGDQYVCGWVYLSAHPAGDCADSLGGGIYDPDRLYQQPGR